MGLDDFTSGDNSSDTTEVESTDASNGNNRRSQMFTKEKFEEVLQESEYEWEEKDYDWTQEWVYETDSSEGKFIMRVYSSVDKRSNESREKDSDAIRLVVLDDDSGRPVMKEKRTNRIKTWKKNLKKKISNISDRKDELNFCDKCGRVMLILENDDGDKFLGCSGWAPDEQDRKCSNTEPLW